MQCMQQYKIGELQNRKILNRRSEESWSQKCRQEMGDDIYRLEYGVDEVRVQEWIRGEFMGESGRHWEVFLKGHPTRLYTVCQSESSLNQAFLRRAMDTPDPEAFLQLV